MFMFAKKHLSATVSGQGEAYAVARAIMAMLDLEPNFTWQQYEQFHAHFEILKRTLFSGTLVTVSGIYLGAAQAANSNDPSFRLSCKSSVCKWPSHFPHSLTSNPESNPAFSAEFLAQHVFIPHAGNPGFDLAYFEKSEKGDPIIICVECRFSEPTAATKLNRDAVLEKRKNTIEQFRPYFEGVSLGGLTVTEENLFLVICAFRYVTKNAKTNLPKNTLVLDRDMLVSLYSPSLASRPQFLVPLTVGEPVQIPE